MGKLFVFSKTPAELRHDLKQVLPDPKVIKRYSRSLGSGTQSGTGSAKKDSQAS